MSESKPFQYLPLVEGCIRLLHLMRPEPGTEPTLHLINNVPYERDRPHYTALSYCWGNLADTVPLKLDNRILRITRSL